MTIVWVALGTKQFRELRKKQRASRLGGMEKKIGNQQVADLHLLYVVKVINQEDKLN